MFDNNCLKCVDVGCLMSGWWSVYTPLGVAKASFAGFAMQTVHAGKRWIKLPRFFKCGGQPTAACALHGSFSDPDDGECVLHRAAGVGKCSVLYAVHVLLPVTFSFSEKWWSYDRVLEA
jgi:hypothetical protein